MNISITEARDRLTQLPDELAASHETVTITRHGEPVLAVMPYELYEAVCETLEVMADPDLMAQLRQSAQDIAAGRLIPIEQIRAELDAEMAAESRASGHK